jgi:nucleoside-diphosphate-sugar epimerase
MEKILITGAAGFIGSSLARHLLQTGRELILFVRSKERLPREFTSSSAVTIVTGDITDRDAVARAVAGAGKVVHCVVYPNNINFEEARRVNVEGTRHVLEAARDHQLKHVVFLSTCAVYGLHTQGVVDESSPLVPSNDAYCDTKIEAEHLCLAFNRSHVPVTILRIPSVYGPGSRLWTRDLGDMLLSRRFPLINGGRGAFASVYIEDLISAISLVLEEPRACGEVFNVVGEQSTLRDFVTGYALALGAPSPRSIPQWAAKAFAYANLAVARARGLSPAIHPGTIDMLTIEVQYNGDKLRSIGWKPNTTLAEGLIKAAEWYQATTHGAYPGNG